MKTATKISISVIALLMASLAGAYISFPKRDGTNPAIPARSSPASNASEQAAPKDQRTSGEEGSEADFARQFADIKAKAAQEDASAQWKLSEIYGACMPYSLDARKQLATLDYLAELNKGSKAAIDRMKSRLSRRCGVVDNGEPIPLEAVDGWMEKAAANGNAAARIKIRSRSLDPLSGKEVGGFVDEVLASRSPEAMMELSNLASRPLEGGAPERYAGIVGNPVAGAAWGIAACRAGASCGSGSLLMDAICTGTGKCNYSTYEEFITSELVPAGERGRLDAALSKINELYKP